MWPDRGFEFAEVASDGVNILAEQFAECAIDIEMDPRPVIGIADLADALDDPVCISDQLLASSPMSRSTCWNEACGNSSTRFRIMRSIICTSSLWQDARMGIGAVAIAQPYSRLTISVIVQRLDSAAACRRAWVMP